MKTKALMIMGAGSDVGKSLLVAGLCRAYTRRGLKVRPFKPQNMSNNAAVTADGGEIGRAQALQARACGVPLSVHMNPVLLKPQSETGSQVVVQGQVMGNESARGYRALKPVLLPSILESYTIVRQQADLVVIEGAGSPAEINLRDSDVANFGFALEASVPVVLVGDVERGGVIAQLVGTHALLEDAEKALMRGFIVNKFRGDVTLFDAAVDEIATRTGWTGLGVVPWFEAASRLPQEDSSSLPCERAKDAPILIAVPRLPRISNFDDLDPLMAEDDVSVVFVEPGHVLPAAADVVVVPGSKATLSDLNALRDEGWDIDLAAHVRRGGWVVGLCGGYQMLGRHVTDPDGVEGSIAGAPGLGLLDIDTVMTDDKALETVSGIEVASNEAVHGYEMHMGLSDGAGRKRPWLKLGDRWDGAVSESGRVMGGYVHGVFAADAFRHAFLNRIREGRAGGVAYDLEVEKTLDALADHLEKTLDLDALLELAS